MTKAKENDKIEKIDIDKDKIIDEIKKDIKGSLEDDILDTIEFETRNKLDDMERKIYKYKNRTIFKKNIIILILLVIIILEAKLLYDNDLSKYLNLDNNIDQEEEDTILEDEKDLDWYIDKYGYLLDMINTNLDDDNFSYLYDKSYNANEIDDNIKLNMAYLMLDSKDITNNNSVIIVKEDKLKNSYTKIFGSIDNYKTVSFNDGCINFVYNKSNESYMAIDVECDNTKSIKEEIFNIYEEKDKVIIETVLGIYDSKDNTLSTIEGNVVSNEYNNDKLDNYKDDLNEYKYTFIKNKNDYYFNSIEKVK